MVVSYQRLCTDVKFMYQYQSFYALKIHISFIRTIFICSKGLYFFVTKLLSVNLVGDFVSNLILVIQHCISKSYELTF